MRTGFLSMLSKPEILFPFVSVKHPADSHAMTYGKQLFESIEIFQKNVHNKRSHLLTSHVCFDRGNSCRTNFTDGLFRSPSSFFSFFIKLMYSFLFSSRSDWLSDISVEWINVANISSTVVNSSLHWWKGKQKKLFLIKKNGKCEMFSISQSPTYLSTNQWHLGRSIEWIKWPNRSWLLNSFELHRTYRQPTKSEAEERPAFVPALEDIQCHQQHPAAIMEFSHNVWLSRNRNVLPRCLIVKIGTIVSAVTTAVLLFVRPDL